MAEAILDWVAGGRTLLSFSQQPGHPARRTIYGWIVKDHAFGARFRSARQVGFEALLDQCLEIADAPCPEGCTVRRHVQRQRLRIVARLKVLSCWPALCTRSGRAGPMDEPGARRQGPRQQGRHA